MHHTTAVPRGQIRPGADRIVAPVGARVLGDKADRTGLTVGLSRARARRNQRHRDPDRGQVLTPMVVAMADGATTRGDVAVCGINPISWDARPRLP